MLTFSSNSTFTSVVWKGFNCFAEDREWLLKLVGGLWNVAVGLVERPAERSNEFDTVRVRVSMPFRSGMSLAAVGMMIRRFCMRDRQVVGCVLIWVMFLLESSFHVNSAKLVGNLRATSAGFLSIRRDDFRLSAIPVSA